MNAKSIINALGGIKAVSKATGINYMTVASWSSRGCFPAKIQLAYPKLIRKGIRLAQKKVLQDSPLLVEIPQHSVR